MKGGIVIQAQQTTEPRSWDIWAGPTVDQLKEALFQYGGKVTFELGETSETLSKKNVKSLTVTVESVRLATPDYFVVGGWWTEWMTEDWKPKEGARGLLRQFTAYYWLQGDHHGTFKEGQKQN